ncbi:ecotin [Roseibium sp. TrichSKD4]|nr:ecotin [Roseibium sp. TrichSKD4]
MVPAFSFAAGSTVEINKSRATQSSIDSLKPYPSPENGWKRYVLHLPYHLGKPVNNGPMWDHDRSIELVIGRVMEVDCNNYRGAGVLHQETVQGWGYRYLRADLSDKVLGSLMLCSNGSRRQAFVPFVTKTVGYNSAIPVVVYAPEDAVLRYRFWKADGGFDEVR